MFKTILFPTDGSELSEKSTATLIEFARIHQARVIAITVIQPLLMPALGDGAAVLEAGQYETQMKDAARDHINKVAAAASASGVAFEGLIATAANAYDAIVEAAEQHGADIIVMPSHGRTGLSKLLLGSETQSVLSHTTLPVLVLR